MSRFKQREPIDKRINEGEDPFSLYSYPLADGYTGFPDKALHHLQINT